MLHKSPLVMAFPSPLPRRASPPTPPKELRPFGNPFIARRWAEGRRSCPCRTSLRFGDATRGKGFAWAEKFCLTPQAATKFFRPPFRFIGARYRDEVSRFAEGDRAATLTLTRDEPRTLLLEGERLQGFPSCPTASVKWGAGGFAPAGVRAKPRINKFNERSGGKKYPLG